MQRYIEKASRMRFICTYEENSSHSAIDFVTRVIIFFGYAPKTIQADHGMKFSHFTKSKQVHPFDVFCNCYKSRPFKVFRFCEAARTIPVYKTFAAFSPHLE